MPLTFIPLNAGISLLDPILDHIDRGWQASGRPGSIRDELEAKKESIAAGKTRGLLGLEEGKPACVAWIDIAYGSYGSILVHATRPELRQPIAEAIYRSGLMNGKVLEFVCFGHQADANAFHAIFRNMGLLSQRRQKMARSVMPPPQAPLPEGVTFAPLISDLAHVSGNISYLAHQASRDLEGYADFSSAEQRIDLERRIFNGIYGHVIEQACLILYFQKKPVGSCIVVALPGWGHERVAWILDMAVLPELQGRGLGRALLEQALRGIAETTIPVVGLAVTLTNRPAIHLYNKLGFRAVEQFDEYICPDPY